MLFSRFAISIATLVWYVHSTPASHLPIFPLILVLTIFSTVLKRIFAAPTPSSGASLARVCLQQHSGCLQGAFTEEYCNTIFDSCAGVVGLDIAKRAFAAALERV
jgi:hypothetical protein